MAYMDATLVILYIAMGIFQILWMFSMSLFLWISAKIMKLREKRYSTAFLVSLVMMLFTALSFLLMLVIRSPVGVVLGMILLFLTYLVLPWLLIKFAYRTKWGRTFLLWLLWIALSQIGAFILGMLFAIVMLMVEISAFALMTSA